MRPTSQRNFAQTVENSSKGFFGVPLDSEAPVPVCDCIEFIRGNGLTEVGIFRVTGSTTRVKRLQELYNTHFSDMDKKENNEISILNCVTPTPHPFDIASLLKSFFLELPEPIIPPSLKFQFLQAVDHTLDDEQQVDSLTMCVQMMPQRNRNCLSLLISFLKEVSLNSMFNQMAGANLGTCFALCLFHGGSAHEQMILATKGGRVIELLIDRKIPIFLPSVDVVRENTKFRYVIPGDEAEEEFVPIPLDIEEPKKVDPKSKKKGLFKRRNLKKQNPGGSPEDLKKSSMLAMLKSEKTMRSTNISNVLSDDETDYNYGKLANQSSPGRKTSTASNGWLSRSFMGKSSKKTQLKKQLKRRVGNTSTVADSVTSDRRQTYELRVPNMNKSALRSDVSKQLTMLDDDHEFLSAARFHKLESYKTMPTSVGDGLSELSRMKKHVVLEIKKSRKQSDEEMKKSIVKESNNDPDPVEVEGRKREWSFLSDEFDA